MWVGTFLNGLICSERFLSYAPFSPPELDGIIDNIKPVTVNKYPNTPTTGDSLLVLGWGMTVPKDDSSFAEVLQVAELGYIPNDACKSMTNENGQSMGAWILEDHICAWNNSIDACAGDSGMLFLPTFGSHCGHLGLTFLVGSGLVLPGNASDNDVLVGIVSWGIDCAGPFPGVYGRTSYMYDWLESLICTVSASKPANITCNNEAEPKSKQDNSRCDGCGGKKNEDEVATTNIKSAGISIRGGCSPYCICFVYVLFWVSSRA